MPEPEKQVELPTPPKWKALISLRWVGGLNGRLDFRRLIAPAAAVVLITAGVLGFGMLFGEEAFDPEKLQAARDAIEAGDLLQARTDAAELYKLSALTPEQRADVALVLGTALAQSTAENVGTAQVDFAELAIDRLREALDHPLEPADETQARYWLGRSYLFMDEIERAIEPLAAIADRPDALQPETYQLLAGAWLQTKRDAETSLAYNDLAINEEMTSDQRDAVMLQRAKILLALNRIADAREIVAPLTARENPALAQFLLARIALAEGRNLRASSTPEDQALADDLFREALRLFEIAEGRDTLRTRRIPGSNYLRAQCLLELNEPEYALVELDEIERRDARSEEAIAAGFLSAEVLLAQGRPEQAVDRWRIVLDRASAVEPFRNRWISRDELSNRLQRAVRRFWATGAFEEASVLLRSDLHFIPRDQSERLLAQTHEQNAEALRRRSLTQDKDQAAELGLQARLEYQRAGHVLSRLARLRAATREYPDHLWASAQAYLKAEDSKNAIRVLDQFVLNDSTQERTAEALYYLAESHLQLGDSDVALKMAQDCVERFPKHPIRYEARLVASQAAIELDDLAGGEVPLLANLERDLLTPRSAEWRRSLFELGKLYYLEQKWNEAESRLTEAVRRFPGDAEAYEARYLLAETLRQQAQLDRNRSASSAVESQRVGAYRSALSRLQDAVEQTEIALSGLQDVAARDEMPESDRALLRNTAFLRAKLFAELNRFDDAAQAYMEFINHYYGRPETLDAYLAVATVFRRMDQEAEARTAIAQAHETLQALPDDAELAHTSVGTRAQWETLLTWLRSL